jgi:hypothetical protein
MAKTDGTSQVKGVQDRGDQPMRSVASPVAHQGVLDALRRAYDGPVNDRSDEFERLLARLN